MNTLETEQKLRMARVNIHEALSIVQSIDDAPVKAQIGKINDVLDAIDLRLERLKLLRLEADRLNSDGA